VKARLVKVPKGRRGDVGKKIAKRDAAKLFPSERAVLAESQQRAERRLPDVVREGVTVRGLYRLTPEEITAIARRLAAFLLRTP
jgi:hypothetical protein